MTLTLKQILLTLFCWAVIFLPQQATASEVLIVNSSQRQPYLQAIAGLNRVLGGVSYQGVKTIQQTESELFAADSIQSDLLFNSKVKQHQAEVLVAVGAKALAAVANLPLPIVYLMVVNPEKISQGKDNITGVRVTVDPEKELAAIAEYLPTVKKIGIIYDPDNSAAQIDLLTRAVLNNSRLTLLPREVSLAKEVNAVLTRIGPSVEALLLVPDTTVLTAENLDIFSLYSLNSRKPLIAFAPQYLKHGAALALYSTPTAMGEQAGQMVLRLLAGETIDQIPPEASQTLTVETNSRILNKLGFEAAGNAGFQNGEGKP
nr:hypothetical protein [Desulfobulbaceae bacterium]